MRVFEFSERDATVEGTSLKPTVEDSEELCSFLFLQPHCLSLAIKIEAKEHLKERVLPLPF
jgi:hypothetical protein